MSKFKEARAKKATQDFTWPAYVHASKPTALEDFINQALHPKASKYL